MSRSRILIVEDELIVARDLETQLRALGYEVVGPACEGEEAIRLAEKLRPDLVLMDIRLRGRLDGIAAAEAIRGRLSLPVVYLTAHADEATIQRARVTEPFGYVLKPFEERELRTVVEMALYKHHAEGQLRASERRYHTTLASIGDAVIATDAGGVVTFLNRVAESVTGWPLADAVGRRLDEVFPLHQEESGEAMPNPAAETIRAGGVVGLGDGAMLTRRDGRRIPVEDSAAPIRDNQGELTGAVLVFRDVSASRQAEQERRRLEAQLLQKQRLESLGVLAGGIAHDFNNLLTAILGYTNLAGLQLPPDSPPGCMLREAEHAAHRAADLVRQLLAYAGKGRFVTRPLVLNAVAQETVERLRPMLAAKVVLRTELAPGLPPVEADDLQLRQAVVNLITNASEALPTQVGVVTVRTGSARVEDPRAYSVHASSDARPGEYVFVEVADTGDGIAPDMIERVFEPFFTTKFAGRGLGLAAVQGIVRGHGGILKVTSAPGQGSCFQILLPCAGTPVPPAVATAPASDDKPFRGRTCGTILVVDDEDSVRRVATHVLENAGFRVVAATGGEEGLAAFAADPAAVHAVVMDLTMPGLDGLETTRRMQRIRGDVPVLLMSGYGEPQVLSRLDGARVAGFLPKPFVADQLLRALDKVRARG